jgi:hypothetical protein
VAAGVVLLLVGHIGWAREGEREDDGVSLALLFGSLLTAAPLTVTVLAYRANPDFGWFHLTNEAAMLTLGLLLLAGGLACRIRATTLAGGLMTALFLLTLVMYIRWPEALKNVAVYLIAGGGVFFLAGLLLSIYRDRLLSLPALVKRREGVFRVLSWR